MKRPPRLQLRPDSWLVRLAAWRMAGKGSALALVVGRHIHLTGCTGAYFLQQRWWLRHELEHVVQYDRMGRFWFLAVYFFHWIRVDYHRIPAEVEARAAERKPFPLKYKQALQELLAAHGVPWYLENDFA